MKLLDSRLVMAALLGFAFYLNGTESSAAGPAVMQQSVVQVQSALTEAYRGYGWGGWGYPVGYGYGYGWGYPTYVYASPVVYTYPSVTYVRTPSCYSGCSYVVPYQSSCCCSNTYVPPAASVTGYAYPAQPIAYSTTSSGRTANSIQTRSLSPSTSVYHRSPEIYTPGSTSTTTRSSSKGLRSALTATSTAPRPASAYRSTSAVSSWASSSSRVAAPYPAPPVEYAKPAPVRGAIASRPATADETESVVTARPKALRPNVGSVPVKAVTYANTHSAYSVIPDYQYSAIRPLGSQINYGLARK
jgi:hypothetical protein